MNQISFSLPEILALIGVIQCTYLLVHMTLRTRKIAHAGLPMLYFLVLGAAFTVDFAQNRLMLSGEYYQWFLWFSGPPLSVLLVMQLVGANRTPLLRDYWVLCLLPLVFGLSIVFARNSLDCNTLATCQEFYDLLILTGLMAGAISLLLIFSKKDLMKTVHRQKFGKQRYWLILSLVVLNALFLLVMFMSLTQQISAHETLLLRNVIGIGFVYLVGTTLLRIIPRNVRTLTQSTAAETLSEDERALAEKIEVLLKLEKVYQEPTYSRADLARECKVSETLVSRVINLHFQKSFPQLMNEYRIEDAKQLLRETQASIQAVAHDVGFNSLPSFNRVFKKQVNQAPSIYRKNNT